MSRGGKRFGAGTPQGNLNALKNGQYSRQLRQAFLDKMEWRRFLDHLKDDRQRARAKFSAVLWWISSGSKIV